MGLFGRRTPSYSPIQAAKTQDAALAVLRAYSDDRHFYSDEFLGQKIGGVPGTHIRFLLDPFVHSNENPEGILDARNGGIGMGYRMRKIESGKPPA